MHRSARVDGASLVGGATVVGAALLARAARRFGPGSGAFAFMVVWVPMTWLGTVSRVVQPRLPASYHRLRAFERDGRVYELLGVKTAKRLLRRGPIARFNPDLHLPAERTPERLAHLEQRMEDAEASHAILQVATLPVVLHAVTRKRWRGAGLTLVFDVLMNGRGPTVPRMADEGRVTFRPLARSDFPTVAAWFRQPHVERWWNPSSDPDDIEAKYGPRVDGDDSTSMWIVEIDGVPAGLAQHYRHADHPDHDRAVGVEDAVGIDYLLARDFSGRGLGPPVIAAFARLALDRTPGTRRCVATPAQANRPSWTALERAGFERRGPCQPPDEPIAWVYVLERDQLPA